ncbi:MAG: hypothetical protein EBZ95_11775 [Chitinophagia bacterium]|jgi:hypothetical protein|nr:hypothetical protein [Chitinophagia bacterium]
MEISLIEKEFAELNLVFTDLKILEDGKTIHGPLAFQIEGFTDSFEIEIKIPNDYPFHLPSVYETSNRIPRFDKYHVNTDGTLCLGSRRKISEIFSKERSLMGFVKNAVLPFFFSFCYLVENGVRPYGELSHGSAGLLEDYKEFLGLRNKKEVLDFLNYTLLLYQKPKKRLKIKTRERCRCGSKLRFSKCHKKYDLLTAYYSEQELKKDIDSMEKL